MSEMGSGGWGPVTGLAPLQEEEKTTRSLCHLRTPFPESSARKAACADTGVPVAWEGQPGRTQTPEGAAGLHPHALSSQAFRELMILERRLCGAGLPHTDGERACHLLLISDESWHVSEKAKTHLLQGSTGRARRRRGACRDHAEPGARLSAS